MSINSPCTVPLCSFNFHFNVQAFVDNELIKGYHHLFLKKHPKTMAMAIKYNNNCAILS